MLKYSNIYDGLTKQIFKYKKFIAYSLAGVVFVGSIFLHTEAANTASSTKFISAPLAGVSLHMDTFLNTNVDTEEDFFLGTLPSSELNYTKMISEADRLLSNVIAKDAIENQEKAKEIIEASSAASTDSAEDLETTEPTEPETTEPVIEETEEPIVEEIAIDPRTSVYERYANLGFIIAPNYLRVRQEPSTSAPIVGLLYANSGVDLLSQTPDGLWYHIVSNGVEGYIAAEFVAIGDAAKEQAIHYTYQSIRVIAERLNVRTEPSLEARVTTQIIAGSEYPLLGVEGDWFSINIGGEINGYVHKDFVSIQYILNGAVPYEEPVVVPTINPVRTEAISFGMQYLGGRYVWGGTTLGKGVDCSGFMLKIYEHYGIALNRTSRQQVHNGVPVSFEEMKPGDLLFYNSRKTGQIGHVAMYIGNGQILHAASENRGIVIDAWNYMTPCAARNVIGE